MPRPPSSFKNERDADQYVGRFAPSPTGHLHIGSLTAALASYLDAKANGGRWYVRMENLDPPREMPGADDSILKSLQAHGLFWDDEVLWQSQRLEAYSQTIEKLLIRGDAFYCACSRALLKGSGGIHRGCCKPPPGATTERGELAIRLAVDEHTVQFQDAIQGHVSQNLSLDVGDFVLRRKDQLFAYQLAVVIDDAFMQVTHIMRGSDLLDSTPRQIYLQQLLGLPTPRYSHLPLITNDQQQKLSKQSFAPAVHNTEAYQNILSALEYLQQPKPPSEIAETIDELLRWSTEHWSPESIPRKLSITQKS